MYPETDLPLLKIGLDRINRLKKNLPKLRSDIRAELKKKGLSDEMINLVLEKGECLDEFNTLIEVYSKDANLVAKMITLWRAELASKQKKSIEEIKNTLTERMLERILEKVKEKKIEAGDVKAILARLAQGIEFEEAIKVEKISDDEIELEIRKIVKEKLGLKANAYMGMVMAKLKGKIDAKKAMEIIERIVGK